jgi:hypothetical protein
MLATKIVGHKIKSNSLEFLSYFHLILYMHFYRLPIGVRKKYDIIRERLLWHEEYGIKRYHMINWEIVCSPKDFGGLGVLNLEVMNKFLLCKWLCRLANKYVAWKQLLTKKYLHKETLNQIEKSGFPNSSLG